MKSIYVYAADPCPDGWGINEIPVQAESEKEAHAKAWDGIPAEAKDCISALELVDVVRCDP
jgi:hypothetical protein